MGVTNKHHVFIQMFLSLFYQAGKKRLFHNLLFFTVMSLKLFHLMLRGAIKYITKLNKKILESKTEQLV